MIATIISKLLSFINFIKTNFKLIAVIIIMILAAFCFYKQKQLDEANNRIDILQNNYEYYLNKSVGIEEDNRVLQLTIEDYKETKDSLIQEIQATQKKLGIKNKKVTFQKRKTDEK